MTKVSPIEEPSSMYKSPSARSSWSRKTWKVIGSSLECSLFLSTSWPTMIEPPLKKTPVLFSGSCRVTSAPVPSSQEPGQKSANRLLTWPAPQVKALIPDAFWEIAFPAGERLSQNGADHEAGTQQKLGVESKGKRLLRKFVPHWSSHW